MKKLFVFLTIVALASCTSDGRKAGLLQKVSHKAFPCDYYVMEVAYAGGRVTGSDQSKAYSNTQEFTINSTAYDTLSKYVGKNVVFSYEDRALTVCEESKILTSITIEP